MSRLYIKKSGRPGARTPAWCPPLQTLIQYCSVLSLSNPIFRVYTLIVSHYFQMSSPQGECRRQEVGDLEFLFVLFVEGLLILLGVGV